MIYSYQISDLERRLLNVIRSGKIHSVDYVNAKCRVSIGDLLTDPLPWIELRAGKVKTWNPPSVGERCIVLSPSGELAVGFVIFGIICNDNPAQSVDENVDLTKFDDGAYISYNRQTHTLNINQSASGSNLTIHVTGNALVEATGNCTVSAGLVARIEAGSSIELVAPTVNVTGKVVSSGDVTAGGKSLMTHKHSDPQGGQVSPPI